MKYICLGYMDETKWDTMSQSERDAMVKEKHPGIRLGCGCFEIRPTEDLGCPTG